MRPPLAQERLRLLDDGLVRIKLKRPFSDGTVRARQCGIKAIAGANTDDTPGGVDAASARVFRRSDATPFIWNEEATLLAEDGAPNDHFGQSVTMKRLGALVGADADDTPDGVDAGSVRIFGNSGLTWTEKGRLRPWDGAAGDHFGSSVSLSWSGGRIAMLAHQDFNDDQKDAGDIGAGHTVTALYELVPVGGKVPGAAVDDLKYQELGPLKPAANSGELMTVKLRFKLPDGQTSRLLEMPVRDEKREFGAASPDFRFAAAVAEFGMLLRNSPFKGDASYSAAIDLAESGVGVGRDSAARRELISLVKKAESLGGR